MLRDSKNALFIVFEGPHASGKSYYAKALQKKLTEFGREAIYTKEPFDATLKKIIRKFSIRESNDAYVLFYLLCADRRIHLQFIQEMLQSGKHVISDRYAESTSVYQRMQGIPASLIAPIERTWPRPSLLFYIDTPFNVRKNRIMLRSGLKDMFYEPKMLKLENKLYNALKHKCVGNRSAFIVDGQNKNEVDRIFTLVMKAASQRSRS
jgi:dTMP kinase